MLPVTDPRFDLWADWEAERNRLTMYRRKRANVCGCTRCDDQDRADELDVLIAKSRALMADAADFILDLTQAGTLTDHDLDLEFAYTSHQESCKAPYAPDMYCRRRAGHAPPHATGFDTNRQRWDT